MSSIRLFPSLPSQLRTYVSVTTVDMSNDFTVPSYEVTALGAWSTVDLSARSLSGAVYADLGKVVFHNPVAFATLSSSTPPVDVRKIRPVTADGKTTTGDSFYAPLGTRVKDPSGLTTTPIPGCWIGLNATSTVSRL